MAVDPQVRGGVDPGEVLAAALEKRATLDPVGGCGCCDGDVEWTAAWLRNNAVAVLEDPERGDGLTETVEARVIAEWGRTPEASPEAALERVRRARAFSPPIEARAQKRLVRTWPDGGKYVGPWEPLTEPEPSDDDH